jgi:hypothetical protein
MRSLPVMFALTLALTSLAACDKKEESKDKDKAADKAEKTDAKEGEKADAKKTGEEEVAAATAEPESGCIHEEKPAHAEGEGCDHGAVATPTGSTGHFGAAFAVAESKPLAAVLASGVAGIPEGGTPVKVTGTVGKVCQKKGCWMVITDGEVTARVLVADHAFAIPMDGEGKAAIVEGTLEVKELTEANVAHLKQDGDSTIKGGAARQEFFLHATAVELSANS